MPLPHFLLLICVVIVAAGVSAWAASAAGVSLAAISLCALVGAGLLRLMARVE